MTDSRRPRERPSLADLHARALGESPDEAKAGAERFLAWFDREVEGGDAAPAHDGGPARGAGARSPVEEAVPWWRGGVGRGLLLGGCAAAVAVVAGGAFAGRSRSVPLAPPSHGSVATAPDAARVADPCREATRAVGEAPLVDDFEDGNELVALHESRNGYWVIITDTDPAASEPVLLPALRPDATATNRYALHVTGGRRTKWGASVQVELGPTCYDASAYRGIAFDVHGPGRLLAGVRTVDAVPVDRGGTCASDCYASHLHPIDATSVWTHHEIRWSDLHQRGKAEPVDPRRLSGLEFLVQPADTPYDLWIDDVAFLR